MSDLNAHAGGSGMGNRVMNSNNNQNTDAHLIKNMKEIKNRKIYDVNDI